ncbi:polysaccharide lyase family protein [Telmatobacter bradus]|uniref:polysaccharide lyase family protein n=1 Tax=Telmatobacter bradus TaxID=474953 RepID=UPI003B43BF9C
MRSIRNLILGCGVFFLVVLLGDSPASSAEEQPHVAKVTTNAPVKVSDNGDAWTLDNGIVRLTVHKSNGNPQSILYNGVEILTHGQSWEQLPSGTIAVGIAINPKDNGGERADIAVRGVNPGKGDGHSAFNIETHYTMERGVSGFYTYTEFSHPASYPTSDVGEGRFTLEAMSPVFDWLSVDEDRNLFMVPRDDLERGVVIHAKEQRILTSGLYKNSVEHKYNYNALMYKLQAWGWSSTKDHIGVYFMNPSTEYIGGGAEKLDLIDHMGGTVLDYWTSGHYAGGDNVYIPQGEDWKHVVGPLFIYFNKLDKAKEPSKNALKDFTASYGSGQPDVPVAWHDNATTLWEDAVEKSKEMKAAWPFDWVRGVDYPHKDGRATVSGQFILDDAQAESKKLPHLTVGLAHPDYPGSGNPFQLRAGNGTTITWPHDGNYYQFWADGKEDGSFTIPNVRPGSYTLHAFADGVLGEYAQANITVVAGRTINLGKLDWKPVRYGKQVWEIGYPDRAGDKFYKGDGANYWLWGWPLRYGDLFPNDVTYTIGKSDYHRDWFFEEVPHSTTEAWKNPAAKDPLNQRFGWVHLPDGDKDMWKEWGHGRATTWTVKFTLPAQSKGTAVLRVALAGADGGGGLQIGVNGQQVGTLYPVATNAIRYNTNQGVWNQYAQTFAADLLKTGENSVTFTVPEGDVTTGVVWDYVRLELNDGSAAYPTAPKSGRLN